MRNLTEIIIHCTATPNNWWDGKKTSEKVAEVKAWHTRDRGWSDIGYHYLIDRDGTIARGRPMERDGAHVRGRNRGTVGISLFGGRDSTADGQFADNYTPEQEASLRSLIDDLQNGHPSITKISGHNEYAAKACPGFRVRDWLEGPWGALPEFLTRQEPAPIQTRPEPRPAASVADMDAIADLIEETDSGSSSTVLRSVLTRLRSGLMGGAGLSFGGYIAGAWESFTALPYPTQMMIGGGIALVVAVAYFEYRSSVKNEESRKRKGQKSEVARMHLARMLERVDI